MKNRLHPLCVRAAVLLACAPAAQAQVIDAGRALRESQTAVPQQRVPPQAPPLAVPAAPAAPVADAAPEASFTLQHIVFKGNTAVLDADLQQLVADKIGQRVTYADIQELAARVTAYYRKADYLFTDAIVPAQEITGGTVEISVLEGRLGRIRIERLDDVHVSEARISAMAHQLPQDRPLTQQQLERAMLLLSDTPGMATQAALETGDTPGTYDLVIEVKATPRTTLTADFDNQGSTSTGRYRAGILGRINSPFGIGDNLDLRLLNSFGKGLLFGRLAYEMPIGTSGLRVNVAAGHIQYELGGAFSPLDADGRADVFELGATYPLIRSRLQNLFGKATLEYKRLDDNIGAVDQASRKYVTDLDLGLIYERRDQYFGGGFLSGGFDLYRGHLDIRSEADRALDQGVNGRGTDGDFTRLTYQASRLQYLNRSFSGYVALAGQWTNRNLDSAEKIAAGGPRSVRAFSASTGIGDEAVILNAELRWNLAPDATLSAFYDVGRVRLFHAPVAGETNRVTLAGPGLGLYKAVASGLSLRGSVAWPTVQTAAPGVASEHGARIFGQLVKAF